MITSFFEKSKPFHFLILGALIIFGFVWTLLFLQSTSLTANDVFSIGPLIGATVLSVVLLDFILSKNNLTRRNAYAIFIYTSFMIMLPVIFESFNMLWANIFLLLSLRRIFSIRNDSNSEVKIFEAALWITLASLFYFWSLLFLVPLWIAVIKKPRRTYKQMLIPIVGFLTVLLLNYVYHLLINDRPVIFFEKAPVMGWDWTAYHSVQILLPATLIFAILIWSGVHRMQNPASIPLKERANYWMLFIVTFTSIVVAVCAQEKDGSELIFLFTPTAILCANYIEGNQNNRFREKDKAEVWFKEMLLWVIAIFGIVFLLI